MREILRSLAKKDLFFLCEYVLRHRESEPAILNREYHGELCDWLQRGFVGKDKTQEYSNRKLLLAPRGTLKSTIASRGMAIFLIINDPNITILLTSSTNDNAQKKLRAIAEVFEKNEFFKWLFPELIPRNFRDDWTNSKILIPREATDPEFTVECQGADSELTSRHYDCLTPETLVYTSKGYQKVKNIQPGQRVLTDNGKFSLVKKTAEKESSKNFVTFKTAYQTEKNTLTEDHKLLIWRDNSLKWREAGSLKVGDYLATPTQKNFGSSRVICREDGNRLNEWIQNKEIWRLIGYWLAEGCASEGNRNRLCFKYSEKKYIQDVVNIVENEVGVTCKVGKMTASNTKIISFCSAEFKKLLNKFGTHSYNKFLPPFAFNIHEHKQIEMLKGYFRGDGCISKNGNVHFCSVSYNLLAGLQLVLAKLEIVSHLSVSKKQLSKEWVVGKLCNARPKYSLVICDSKLIWLLGEKVESSKYFKKPQRSFFIPGFWLIPVKEVVKEHNEESKKVYDIQVKDRHCFYIPGAIVHNCIIDDDIVGKENSETAEQILKVKNFYTQSLQLLKKPYGRRLVIGTLWNFSDLYSHILETRYHNFDILVRSIYKNDRYIRNEDGTFRWEVGDSRESVYPELINDEEVQELKEEVTADPNQGISTWKAQYELKIVDEETAVFPQSKSREDEFWYEPDELYDKKLAFSLTLDPAVSESRRADESAFTVRAVDERGVWYLVEGHAERGMDESAVVDKFLYFLNKYPVDLATIETIHFQRYLEQAVRKRCDDENIFFPYMKLPPAHSQASKKDSDLKIRGLAPYYATNKIKFLKNDNFTEGLLFQLWKFPKTAHDDRIDSFAMHNHLPIVASRVWKESQDKPKKSPLKRDRYGYIIKSKGTLRTKLQ